MNNDFQTIHKFQKSLWNDVSTLAWTEPFLVPGWTEPDQPTESNGSSCSCGRGETEEEEGRRRSGTAWPSSRRRPRATTTRAALRGSTAGQPNDGEVASGDRACRYWRLWPWGSGCAYSPWRFSPPLGSPVRTQWLRRFVGVDWISFRRIFVVLLFKTNSS